MASQRFSVVFSSEGLRVIEKEAQRAGKAYDTMLSEAQKSIKETEKSLKDFAGNQEKFAELEADRAKEAQKANRIIAASYRELGLKSERSLQNQKRQAISAFESIKASGTASARDIAQAQAALTRQLDKLDEQIKGVDATARRTGGSGGGFTILKGAIATMIGGVALQGIQRLFGAVTNLGRSALGTANQFEGFANRLELLEGSTEKGAAAFEMLKKAAQTLPIELEEVTQAYISLVNRGFKPTEAQITQLTDFAKSNGKSLQQYVEAVLDASTGEMERLKEFGVQAKKAGDQVTFTFKGQQTTVAATQAEITKYLVELGKLPSVAGYSAKAMETLEGKTANFQDSLSQLANNVGQAFAPLAKEALGLAATLSSSIADESIWRPVAEAVNEIVTELKIASGSTEDFAQIVAGQLRESLRDVATILSAIAEYLRQNPTTVRDWGTALNVVVGILKIIGSILGLIAGVIAKLLDYWVKVVAQAVRLNDLASKGFALMRKDVDAIGKGIGTWIKNITDAGKPLKDFLGMLKSVTGSVIDFGTDVGKKLGNAATSIVGNNNSGGPLLPAPGGAFHPNKFPVTSPYGMRGGRLHAGTDYGTPMGTPLANIWGAGRVTMAGFVGGYGNMVELTLANGSAYRFGHLDRIMVRQGQLVPPGALMGFTGNTGRSTGPHLHLEYYPNPGGGAVPYTGGRGGPEISFSKVALASNAPSRFSGSRRASGAKRFEIGNQLGVYPELEINLSGTLTLDEESRKKIEELRRAVNDSIYSTIREANVFLNGETPEDKITQKYDGILTKLNESYVAVKKVISAKNELNQSYDAELAELRSLDSLVAEVTARQQAELAVVRELGIAYLDLGQTMSLTLSPEFEGLAAKAGFFESRIEEMASTISGAVGSAFNGLFDDLFEGSKSFGDAILGALGGILKNVGQMFLNFATQMLQEQLFKGLTSLLGSFVGGGGAGGAGFFGNIFGGGFGGGALSFGSVAGFASGGYVRGPGTTTSDSIVARLSRGEYVLPAKSVQAIGLPALEAIRQSTAGSNVTSRWAAGISTGFVPGYAQGGLITGQAGRTVAGSVVNINVTTPNADSFNRSEMQIGARAGEQIRRAQQRR